MKKSTAMAARSTMLGARLLCNRCFKRSQPLLAAKRFTSNNNSDQASNARSLHANLWEEYRKRKSIIEGMFLTRPQPVIESSHQYSDTS